MKHIILIIITLTSIFSFSQEENEALLLAAKKANNFVYEGNELIDSEDFVSAEMAYRKAISEQPTGATGAYNLGTSYYKSGNFNEALYRLEQAVKTASTKSEKHKAFHNIGNILMQNEKCKEAVEAYKNALRNNPSDNETRYNLGVAKVCAEQQQQQDDQNKEDKDNKDENKENKDQKENQDNKDKEGEDKEDKKDEGDDDKKEGEDEKDEDGKPKDEKEDEKDKGKDGDKEKEENKKPQQQPGQLSPQQIKSLLEAMNNQEQKVQEKMNAEKQKGVKIKTDKDW
ncbi:tetratricopeptide repeat protein [Algibacter amylolyticus]|uniref:Tetratricopeptide repeat protein n=1 Tax=Algibacter amylolyticus TaxID=1608400 RepID=A0A5M7BD49_9FLAO|nr:tetratricopeptide repeat protein [Algibacter amylolyticus]KAA5827576.1 tetratricopeptide repeat protein [Algibacter amylolyticus]MBB5266784.1 tetratricopeptide (TPR) repeat protein [Algibacter amylolyticus]TSJ81821.1 tetratricopeptide repeat protein [Algibacter amylolyticus]